MIKWYLIWEYHDTYVEEFNSNIECSEYLEHLKDNYRNDENFHWKVIKGIQLERF